MKECERDGEMERVRELKRERERERERERKGEMNWCESAFFLPSFSSVPLSFHISPGKRERERKGT